MDVGKDVGAVMQAAAILRVLSDTTVPLGVTSIARAADLNPSTTLNLLRTLVRERLVGFEPGTKTYGLDLGLLELARSMLAKTNIDLLRPRLQRIANQYEATVSIWRVTHGERLLMLDRLKPEVGVHIEFQIAMRLPLYAGANGRAVAAVDDTPREVLHDAFARIRWNTPITFEAYMADVARARELGYALDMSALIKSVVSAAAVVRDAHGRSALVLSAHTFNGQLSDEALHALGHDLAATCTESQAALFGRAA